ncbi:MAG: peptidoglycan-binding protein [Oscillospiraceae bacterium]|nr:peptidoglycan-binding protein [Oscillospiraceae bacterium]
MTGTPYIPEKITVHLGAPSDKSAPNVTLDFPDYIANVASSELFPTWPETALRANIYAIVSFALNRIYTEWYRSRGYDFDITSTTQYDQAFVNDRTIYQSVEQLADELFNDYVVKQGQINPYFTAYCDGRQVQCDGLTQWGTVELAEKGYLPYEMLQYFYGNDIDIVKNAPVRENIPSYGGTPLEYGSAGPDVALMQTKLNRISKNYPAINKINPVSGIMYADTENAVRTFQSTFGLKPTGIIDKATWYKISYIYAAVKKLAELDSEGVLLEEIPLNFSDVIQKGDTGFRVRHLQYYLAVIGQYYKYVDPVDITGNFGEMTENSVKSFQRVYGLPETGVVDRDTWQDIYRAYAGIVENAPVSTGGESLPLYPNVVLREGMTSEYVKVMQEYLTYIHRSYPEIPEVSATGYYGPITKNAVTLFQQRFGLEPTGTVNANTWNEISSVYSDLYYGYVKKPGQNPGYTIT